MIRLKEFLIVGLILLLFPNLSTAQKPLPKDSLKKLEINNHSPRLASIYSAILPGLGQVYNKKYWKVPLIYAGFGALAYSLSFSDSKYSLFLNEYNNRLTQDSLLMVPDLEKYSDDNILELKNYYQRNRELTIIGFVVLYALNIVDATVDGHLYSFDISDDLSLKVNPYINQNAFLPSTTFNGGLQLTFSANSFRKRQRTHRLPQIN